MEKTRHIVSFSGGKDSTAMLFMMMEKGLRIDEVLFCDTGMEFPAMYAHIARVQKRLNLKITILRPEKPFEYYLAHHIKTMGKYKGERGYGWPGHIYRWCTNLMKAKPSRQYLKNIPHILYLGITADEKHRLERPENKKKHYRFPMIDWNITGPQALEYCKARGFNWNDLYKKFPRVSCWCCPLQSQTSLKILFTDYPALWKELKRLDSLSYREFSTKFSIPDLEKKFILTKGEQNR